VDAPLGENLKGDSDFRRHAGWTGENASQGQAGRFAALLNNPLLKINKADAAGKLVLARGFEFGGLVMTGAS
jgi:hypothetical protein